VQTLLLAQKVDIFLVVFFIQFSYFLLVSLHCNNSHLLSIIYSCSKMCEHCYYSKKLNIYSREPFFILDNRFLQFTYILLLLSMAVAMNLFVYS